MLEEWMRLNKQSTSAEQEGRIRVLFWACDQSALAACHLIEVPKNHVSMAVLLQYYWIPLSRYQHLCFWVCSSHLEDLVPLYLAADCQSYRRTRRAEGLLRVEVQAHVQVGL